MGHLSSTSANSNFQIGPHTIAARAFLAPMAGITDLPFRRMANRYGAGLVVSEMIACEWLAGGSAEAQLRAERSGVGLHVVQLAGCETNWIAEGARIAEAAGADIVDLNMGCPAKCVTTGAAGAALLRDVDNAVRLVEAASPFFRFGPGLVMVFIQASMCSSVIRLIGTSAMVLWWRVIAGAPTDEAILYAIILVALGHHPTHRVFHVLLRHSPRRRRRIGTTAEHHVSRHIGKARAGGAGNNAVIVLRIALCGREPLLPAVRAAHEI